ncbi:MAG: cupin domain-containing protein [Xanthobacteraceae bacterium]|nr:cupin domain-containing protein [Xanthobacteraceae bacterium]
MMSKPEQLWFLNTRVTVRVAGADGANHMTVLEHEAPCGDSPPLHVHAEEDEVFHVIAGELRCRVGGREFSLRAGDTVRAPKDVPHTYLVVSPEGARFLTVTCVGHFERLVRALGRPAAHDGLPVASGAPTPEQATALADACLAHGITLVGPPLVDMHAAP